MIAEFLFAVFRIISDFLTGGDPTCPVVIGLMHSKLAVTILCNLAHFLTLLRDLMLYLLLGY